MKRFLAEAAIALTAIAVTGLLFWVLIYSITQYIH